MHTTAPTLSPASPPGGRLVAPLLAALGRRGDDPRLAIHPRDEMLPFLAAVYEEDAELAACAYYRSGWSIAQVLAQVLRWRFGDGQPGPVLDFASGYGRVTRFLVDHLPGASLTVADVLADAVEFQRAAFGVRGVVAPRDPERLDLPGPFSAILVTSLFTHLPEALFRGWLRALVARLGEGGLLAFSTHATDLLPAETRPAGGFAFEGRSESASLAAEEYGSTWVDEAFVRGVIAGMGGDLSARRLPRALCNYQDLWVVVRGAAAQVETLEVDGEPELLLEECRQQGGDLRLQGWVAARYGGVEALEVRLDGQTLGRLVPDGWRPDVAAVVGDHAVRSGFSVALRLPESASRPVSVLELRAVDRRGVVHPAWIARLETSMLAARTARARVLAAELHHARCQMAAHQAWATHELATLQARLAAMQASRFWKLRNAWFALKRALRLTDEP